MSAEKAAHRAANIERVKAQQAEYRERNRAVLCAKRRDYYYANHERILAQRRAEWASNAGGVRDKLRAYSASRTDKINENRKRLYRSDPDRFRRQKRADYERHRESRLAYLKAYGLRNPERVKAGLYVRAHARRARERGAPGRYTVQQWEWRRAMWGGRCYVCGADGPEVDHVIPLSRGGTNWPANLRPICRKCNTRKAAKDWRKFV